MSKYQVMPPLSAEEYEMLKADIRDHGVYIPIEFDEDGAVLDGHHRIQICEELGIEDYPRVIRAGMKSEADKRTYARSINLHRRHLTSAQRRELIRAQLAETPELSDRAIASALGVSDKTVGVQRRELERAAEIPQLDTSIGSDGKEHPRKVPRQSTVSVYNPTPRDERILRNPETVARMVADNITSPVYAQRRVNQEAKAIRKNAVVELAEKDYKFFCSDVSGGLPEVADNSVDLLLVDPPYAKDAIPLYRKISELAARVLKDSGSLLVMCGGSHLPIFLQELTSYMKYWWCISYQTPHEGCPALTWLRVFSYWKPVIWLVKNSYPSSRDMVHDVVIAPPDKDGLDKRYHQWGQSVSGFQSLIERFTNPGDVVLDCCCGGGTTGVAAANLGRRVILSDIEQENVEISRQRVMEAVAAHMETTRLGRAQ